MTIKRPDFLRAGDRIGIAATARWIEPSHVETARRVFQARGWEIVIAENVFSRHFQLAGDQRSRVEAFQGMLDRTDISAIIVGRGGYGTVDIIDHLDWSNWLDRPTWICGYSDVTALLGQTYQLGVSSIHSTMPVSFHDATETALNQLCDGLEGRLTAVEWQSTFKGSVIVEAPLVGGNLSVLYSLLGSRSFPKGEMILFLEDVDEMIYHIHRMMIGLARSGALSGVKAVVLGGMTKMKDNTVAFGFPADNPWGQSALEAVQEVCGRLEIPVVDGFPAGHMSDNRAFYHGMVARLSSEGQRAKLTWDF